MNQLPKIAVTMGDPAGVGPEVCLALLANESLRSICRPLIFGTHDVLKACAEHLHKPLNTPVISLEQLVNEKFETAAIVDVQTIRLEDFEPTKVSAATGEASYQYIQRAIDAALAGHVDSVTTAPINKEAIHAAGHYFPGHTEMFADRCNAERSCMMQYSTAITCSFVTTHCGYADVPKLMTTQRISDVIDLTVEALRRLRNREPKIVVCGLNPHAGEHGLFGDREEERIIVPAIEAARLRGIQIEGPLPPDTAFLPWKRETTDAFICMYHDQGHIPVKALAFDSAVNTTLGLSIIRTSVDHGTACDIAWQGRANPGSMFEAIKVAALLASKSR